jgi:hypothetical protein
VKKLNDKKTAAVVVYVVSALMMSTATVYLITAFQEVSSSSSSSDTGTTTPAAASIPGLKESANGQEGKDTTTTNNIDNKETAKPIDSSTARDDNDKLSSQLQTVFFTIVGIAYVPVGIWMLKDKRKSITTKTPYIIAIVGSAALMVFYMLSRTVNLPIVGIQTDIGAIDIVAKVLQAAIIAGSIYILTSAKMSELQHMSQHGQSKMSTANVSAGKKKQR